MRAVPLSLKRAIGVGIGLFILFIGFVDAGVIRQPVGDGPVPVEFVFPTTPGAFVFFLGLLIAVGLLARRVPAALLISILVTTVIAIITGVQPLPETFTATPDFSTVGKFDLGNVFTVLGTLAALLTIFSFMLTDFFDTMGTVISVGEQAGFVDAKGNVPGIREILTVDSIAASVGGLFGASSITTYIESAAGVAEGGRTGLTSVVTGALFAVAAFFAPIVATVGGGFKIPNASQYGAFVGSGFQAPAGDYFVYPITAGALIVVGFLMMRTVREIPWTDLEEAFPAFLTIVGIPLTYNISYGIGFGFISYVLIKTFHGKARQVHWLMWVVSLAFAVTFVLPAVEKLFK